MKWVIAVALAAMVPAACLMMLPAKPAPKVQPTVTTAPAVQPEKPAADCYT